MKFLQRPTLGISGIIFLTYYNHITSSKEMVVRSKENLMITYCILYIKRIWEESGQGMKGAEDKCFISGRGISGQNFRALLSLIPISLFVDFYQQSTYMTRNARWQSRRPRYKAAVHVPDFGTFVPLQSCLSYDIMCLPLAGRRLRHLAFTVIYMIISSKV